LPVPVANIRLGSNREGAEYRDAVVIRKAEPMHHSVRAHHRRRPAVADHTELRNRRIGHQNLCFGISSATDHRVARPGGEIALLEALQRRIDIGSGKNRAIADAGDRQTKILQQLPNRRCESTRCTNDCSRALTGCGKTRCAEDAAGSQAIGNYPFSYRDRSTADLMERCGRTSIQSFGL
jgi:hypothetical protein